MKKNNNHKSKNIKKSAKKAIRAAKKHPKLAIAIAIIAIVLLCIIFTLFIIRPSLFSPILNYLGMLSNSDNTNNYPTGITPIHGEKLEMTFIDVGQGDSILIQFPDGKNMLMDIGSEFATTSCWGAVDGILKSKNIQVLDYLFITHTDYDHIREISKLADNYELKEFYLPSTASDISATWTKSLASINNETYTHDGAQVESKINYNIGKYEINGQGWSMDCYSFLQEDYPNVDKNSSAEIKNSISPICVLNYANRQVVLTGDSNFKNEEYILANDFLKNVDADILKVAHHGSKGSTSLQFLQAIDAEYAIISTNGESYGHPESQLLLRLNDYLDIQKDADFDGFVQVYRTDKDGNVVVEIAKDSTLNIISQKLKENNKTSIVVLIFVYDSNSLFISAYERKNYTFIL